MPEAASRNIAGPSSFALHCEIVFESLSGGGALLGVLLTKFHSLWQYPSSSIGHRGGGLANSPSLQIADLLQQLRT